VQELIAEEEKVRLNAQEAEEDGRIPVLFR
jgi:hypothetical protein